MRKPLTVNSRPSRFVLCLLALLLLPIFCAAQTPAQWKPDPKLVSQLGPEVSIGDYKIRPPLGFETDIAKTESADTNTIQRFKFHSEQRPDGSNAYLDVDIVTFKPGYRSKPLEALPDIYAKDVLSKYSNLVKAPAERGIVGNIPAIRFYWKGINLKTSNLVHGIEYTMVVGNSTILIIMTDRDPHNQTSLPISEAAALTFRKG